MNTPDYNNNFGIIFNKAMAFALEAHKSQFYDKDKPYIFHLTQLQGVLERFGYHITDSDMNSRLLHIAVFLHDTIEDTLTVSYNDIKKEFGYDIAEIVYAVTDERGRNREERHVKTYPKIKANKLATIVKLADRIANVEYSVLTGSSMLKKYRQEQTGFKEGIYVPDVNDAMWNHLEKLLA